MIIESLLDQDFYKFTMGQAVLHHFPDFEVRYRFKCRNKGVVWTAAMRAAIERELDHFCALRFTEEELAFLSGIRFLKPYFIDFLRLYRPARSHVSVTDEDGLAITVAGPWFLTIFFEIPVLAIVNEVYFGLTTDPTSLAANGRRRLAEKIELARREGFRFSEFGTRRRYSRRWQEEVADTLHSLLPNDVYVGTSNVHLSRLAGTPPVGTMAHEFIQAGQAVDDVTLAYSQRHMLQKWVDEYRGDLGIALSDTLGFDKFLADFDLYFAKLYDGVRHDSGDPAVWGERMIDHYEKLRIDPKTKTLVFSDGLDFSKAAALARRFGDRARLIFGIGTNLTNDFDGVTPLNIVMKLTECNGRPTAKLSDAPGKTMCEDEGFLRYLRSVVGMERR